MPEQRPPNIVLIVCDDIGYGDLGCFGAPYVETPHLDRMACEGLRLTDFHATGPTCTPSRAGLLTGRYPPRVDLTKFALFPDDEFGLPPEEVTLATLLSDAGYTTDCIGKWHLGHHEPHRPIDHGFDTYLGVPYSNDMYTPAERPDPHRWPGRDDDFIQERDHAGLYAGYPDLPLYRDGEIVEQPVEQSTLTERYTREAVDVIERHADSGEPFFTYLAHAMPHPPLHASAEFRGTSTAGLHGDVMAEIDASVGRILDALANAGVDRETLVIFTSDHGAGGNGGSNGPFRGRKGSVWEGGMRVPALAYWPGTIPTGSVSSALTTNLDILPTVASIAGLSLPPDRTIDGRNCSDLLFDPETAASPHEYFYYYNNTRSNEGSADMRAVRDAEGWKLHLESGQLYHLPTDIGEADDVAESNPEVVDRLRSQARTFDGTVRNDGA